MTNKLQLIAILTLTSILITGGFTLAPLAYSTGSGGSSHDDDDHEDDCDREYSNHNGDDESEHNSHDHDDDCEPDPCDCKKPDKFTVRYDGPGDVGNPAVYEIYKKTDKIGDKDPLVPARDVYIPDLLVGEPEDANQIMVSASDFNKEKLGSNIGYRILWDDNPLDDNTVPGQGLEEIARIDIHVSCSQLLYIGQTFTDGEGDTLVTLTVEDGKRGGKTSIPISDPLTCEAEPEPTPKATIILKKAATYDNGADKDTVFTPRIDGVVQAFDVPIEVDAGVEHYISEDTVVGFSPVLIAGDTECPAMIDENFVLKKGQEITCTIYNDDDFVEGQTGGDGVFFARSSVSINISQSSTFDEAASTHGCSEVPPGEARPCVTLDQGFLLVVDEAFELNGAEFAAIVYTVQPDEGNAGFAQCISIVGIGMHTFPGAGDLGVDLDVRGFLLDCSLEDPGDYNVNYAIIKTTPVPTT